MELREELVAIERGLWTGGSELYRRRLDDDCLLAFPSMAGVSPREEVVATVEQGERWRALEIRVEGLLWPTDDVALLTYRASALRGDRPYRALVSSGYVLRDGAWKLAFHHQTPLPVDESSGFA